MWNLIVKSKVENKNRSSRYTIFFIIGIMFILSTMGCEIIYAVFERPKYPNPDDFPYKNLSLRLQVKSINHFLDPIDFKEVNVRIPYYIFSRKAVGDSILLYHYFLQEFSEDLNIKITKNDTLTAYYDPIVVNYTGYKKKNGGDESILSHLDSIGQWNMQFSFDFREIVLSSGDTISGGLFSKVVPDTIKDGRRLIIEITFDLDSLFSIVQPNGNAYVRKSKISFRNL